MPRKSRVYVPGVPAHIVQRGHNRQATFFAEDDYHFYLDILAQGCRRYGVQLHAYCLMTNHIHLLMTPRETDSISRVMQHLGRMYVLYVNKTYRRSGSLWEGRHKSSLVNAEEYLLSCYRYIEMNPVAASMVERPEDYPWSSYHYNALGVEDEMLTEHELYLRLGANDEARRCYYQSLFVSPLMTETVDAIKGSLKYNYPLGNQRFIDQIEQALGRSIGHLSVGRPAKQSVV